VTAALASDYSNTEQNTSSASGLIELPPLVAPPLPLVALRALPFTLFSLFKLSLLLVPFNKLGYKFLTTSTVDDDGDNDNKVVVVVEVFFFSCLSDNCSICTSTVS